MTQFLKQDLSTDALFEAILERAKIPRRDGIVMVSFENADAAHGALQRLGDVLGEDRVRSLPVHPISVGFDMDPETPHRVIYLPRVMVNDIKRWMQARDAANPQVREPAIKSTLEYPRRLPGPDPRKSVNTFMVSLAVLDPVIDLCDRLDAKRTSFDGRVNVYYSSRSTFGLKFRSQEDAQTARDTFRKILKDGAAIGVVEKMVKHKPEYWVEVPSELAAKIVTEMDELVRMRREVAEQFENGDRAGAKVSRRALYDIMDDMGFAKGHVAAQMARKAVSDTQSATTSRF